MNINAVLVLIFALAPNLTKAGTEIVEVNSNWLVGVTVDDFTDKKECTVSPYNRNYNGDEKIYIKINSAILDGDFFALIAKSCSGCEQPESGAIEGKRLNPRQSCPIFTMQNQPVHLHCRQATVNH